MKLNSLQIASIIQHQYFAPLTLLSPVELSSQRRPYCVLTLLTLLSPVELSSQMRPYCGPARLRACGT